MKSFSLKADMRLLSINKAFIYLRNGSRCRSKEYNVFSLAISKLMLAKREEFKAFNDSFNSKLHEIHAELVFYTDNLYTLDKKLSQKSGDLGNMEKCLSDCILIGSIDDSFITKWTMKKLYSETPSFEITYNIIERDNIST